MSLTFYFAPMSTATLTELVLEELGVACEKVRVDLQKGETKTPAFLKLNPNGKVPTLVHDGVALWESAAITLYLGEMFGVDKKLWPAAGPKRGEAMKWVVWSNVTLGEAVGRWARQTSDWFPADERNAKAGESAKADMHHGLGILNQALEGKSFLLGYYSLADTHLNSFVDWLRFMKVDMTPYANLNAWSQRCAARPAYVKVMSAAK